MNNLYIYLCINNGDTMDGDPKIVGLVKARHDFKIVGNICVSTYIVDGVAFV